ncbi:retrovirus-related pol polyprotein from transposon TNT 1-94 [Tanacetum coccineum]
MDTTPRYKNENQTGQFGNQRTMTVARAKEIVGSPKPKRVKDSTYHKEKMLLCKQAEKGVPLQVEQYDWLADTDEEIDEQELEAHYSYMAKIQEVPTADSGTNSEPLEHNDQNVEECDDERVALANLIANLKLEVDENKKIQKQLKKANTTLAHELTECKSIVAETSRTLEEPNSIRDSCLVALQNKHTKFERLYNASLFIVTLRLHQAYDGQCITAVQFLLRNTGYRRFGNEPICLFLVMEIWFKETSRSKSFTTRKSHHNLSQLGNSVCGFGGLHFGNLRFCRDPSGKRLTIVIVDQILYTNKPFQETNPHNSKSCPPAKASPNSSKDQLCSSCEVIKAKRRSIQVKDCSKFKGRIEFSFTWTYVVQLRLHSINGEKIYLDETPEVLKDFLTMIQRNLQAPVISVRTDRGTEFLNKTLHAFFKEEGIEHQTYTPRTPEQNGVVERRNRTLVEAARTMLSASKLPLFFWAEAIATACYTQNRSIITNS